MRTILSAALLLTLIVPVRAEDKPAAGGPPPEIKAEHQEFKKEMKADRQAFKEKQHEKRRAHKEKMKAMRRKAKEERKEKKTEAAPDAAPAPVAQ
ncbi:MAG: hypothetical protein HYV14_13830 [Elusimicrobia bacterium]|nr:hypothetical protein [Elusimicrobiota bacterium]